MERDKAAFAVPEVRGDTAKEARGMMAGADLLGLLAGVLLFVAWVSERIAANGCDRDD